MPFLRIKSAGFITSVQDAGRVGYAHYGVSASGPADSLSLRMGNLLVGNPEDAAALEMTLVGGTFEFESDGLIALSGSSFAAQIGNAEAPFWTSFPVKAGQMLTVGPSLSGARCYLCIRGGIGVPPVLGSRSTHLLTGIGGFEGRALKQGDRIPLNSGGNVGSVPLRTINQETIGSLLGERSFRVTSGPQSDFFAQESLDLFLNSTYEVLEDSNRMGLRLRGPQIVGSHTGDMLTEGVSLGAIQISHDGNPIVLFVEHQTTGGYPKIANIISADLHRVGQLRPRESLRFELVSFPQARDILLAQESMLKNALRTL